MSRPRGPVGTDVQEVIVAASRATRRRHQRNTTPEHLLRGLVRAASLIEILRLCGLDLEHLKQALSEYFERLLELSEGSKKLNVPDATFERIIERCVYRGITTGRKVVESLRCRVRKIEPRRFLQFECIARMR